MLEFTYYNTEKIEDLKDIFTIIFVLVDDVYDEIIPSNIKNRINISESKLSDSEIISISIIGEAIMIDSEKAWFFFVKKSSRIYFLTLVIEQGLIELNITYLW